MESLTNFFRFTAPPILTICFVAFADFQRSFHWWLTYTQIDNGLLTMLLGTGGVIIAVGFIISSITYAGVNRLGLRSTGYCGDDKNQNSDLRELEIWRSQHANGKHIVRQIMKRWDMAMANANACMALLLAPVIIQFLSYYYSYKYSNPYPWFFVWLFLMLIFGYNARKSYVGVRDINRGLTQQRGGSENGCG